ncbi:MAG: hypothetical protein K1X72_18410 [Pyrinomonadaceae bacterium]|nr:hypothetical protein [Pyrinomonadaceae bacterium]
MGRKINFLFVLFLVFAFNAFAEGSESLPLSKCWQLNYSDFNSNLIASDNERFLLISKNSLINISENGTIIWKTNLPDESHLSLFLIGNRILLVNYLIDKKVLVLRTYSQNSGLLTQTKEFNLQEFDKPLHFQLAADGKLFLADKKTLFSVDINNWESSIRKFEEKNQIISLDSSQVISLSNDNDKEISLHSLFNQIDSKVFSFQKLPEKINSIFSNINKENLGGQIFITDDLGSIFGFDTLESKNSWNIKFGGRIRQTTLFNKSLYISADDNYIYRISISGKKEWKVKLFSRNQFYIDEKNGFLVTVNLGERFSEFIDLEKGKIINQIELEDENYFTERPYIIGKTYIFITKNGMLGYNFGECKKAG